MERWRTCFSPLFLIWTWMSLSVRIGYYRDNCLKVALRGHPKHWADKEPIHKLWVKICIDQSLLDIDVRRHMDL